MAEDAVDYGIATICAQIQALQAILKSDTSEVIDSVGEDMLADIASKIEDAAWHYMRAYPDEWDATDSSDGYVSMLMHGIGFCRGSDRIWRVRR